MRCSCGAELPVSEESVEFARAHKFYKLDAAFNGYFYELMRQCAAWTDREKGFDRLELQDLLRLLGNHREHLGLKSRRQVRGLLGREYGLFDDDGRLRVELANRVGMASWERAQANSTIGKLQARAAEAEEAPSSVPYRETTIRTRRLIPEEWDAVVDEALLACGDLREQGGIQAELRWLNANMMEWPDFRRAPSRTAVKWWLILNNPNGVDAAHRELLKAMWAKRLMPGDSGQKKKQAAAFDEDEDTAEADAHDEECMRRLFGQGDGEEFSRDGSGPTATGV